MPNLQPIVRPAEPNDEDAVFDLACMMAISFVVERSAFASTFHATLQDSDCYLHVAESGGQVIGYLLGWSHLAFYANGSVAWVQEVAVKSEHRRLGVGKALMEHFENWSKERGCKLVSLATSRSGHFYEAVGYANSAAYYKKIL